MQPWLRGVAPCVRELVAEPCPGVDVDQDVGEIELRQPTRDVRGERRRRGGSFGAGEPADVQLAVFDVNGCVARGQRAIERDDRASCCRRSSVDAGSPSVRRAASGRVGHAAGAMR
jgi:hypothetical protein